MNIKEINAQITTNGVKVIKADRDMVLSVKGAPTSDNGIASWSAIRALVRIGATGEVLDRMAQFGDTTNVHPTHVADILDTLNVPSVTVDIRDISPECQTPEQIRNATTTLSNLFRLYTKQGGKVAPRFGDRIGASVAVAWCRDDIASPIFHLIAIKGGES